MIKYEERALIVNAKAREFFLESMTYSYYVVAGMRRKPVFERAIRRTISMPVPLFRHAEREVKEKGFSSFSHYLQELIRIKMQASSTDA